MNCYNCGCRLSEKDFCTGCGVDVGLYKKIMYASNFFYNEGLEKANVRDLSGAIVSLRQSLKFNKNNVEARNLLGLVYYEMGEVVPALSEWVISKNLRDKKNLADDYLDVVQTNPTLLDTINQTIKKYNQSLAYCYQDSQDLAVIQLKKVLSLNPNYVKAHQLLALLYMQAEEWEKARKELMKCSRIDTNNTTTLRYKKEVDAVVNMDESVKKQPRRKEAERDVIQYRSGNETIIQPLGSREGRSVSTVLNIVIGIAIGVAAACFLILPARISSRNSAVQDELRAVSEQLDRRTSAVEELEQQVSLLTQEKEKLEGDLENYAGDDGTMSSVNALLEALGAYMDDEEDMDGIAAALEKMDAQRAEQIESQAFQDLYRRLLDRVGPTLAASYYEEGMDAYRKELYEDAIEKLIKAVEYDGSDADILYNLGNAYRQNENVDEAIEVYTRVVDSFPGTENARRAQNYIEELSGAAVAPVGNAASENNQGESGSSNGDGQGAQTDVPPADNTAGEAAPVIPEEIGDAVTGGMELPPDTGEQSGVEGVPEAGAADTPSPEVVP